MSRPRLRARLDRLERLDDTANRTYGFTIDPAAAKALRDNQARLWELGCKADSPSAYGGPLTSADIAERDRLRESIAAIFYLSFVTLTTTGYGDIVPVHPLARSLCNIEAIVGQLYPATLLARLVTLELQGR
jgi:hypothetical protein